MVRADSCYSMIYISKYFTTHRVFLLMMKHFLRRFTFISD